MNVRELVTKWGFKVDTNQLDAVNQKLDGIKNRLSIIAGIQLAEQMYHLVEKFSEFGEHLNIVAETTGITVEQFQKLAYSAHQANVSQDELQGSVTRLARAVYAARNGNDTAQRSFNKLGISADQVRGFKTTQEALFALSDRMQKINDPIQKVAISQQLLGRGSRNMVAYLSQGSAALRAQGTEFEKLGGVLSKNETDALARAGRAIKEVIDLITALTAKIAAYLAPTIEFINKDFLQFLQTIRGIISVNLDDFFYDLGYSLGAVYAVFKIVVTLMAEFFHWIYEHKTFAHFILEVAIAIWTVMTAWKVLTTVITFGVKIWEIAVGVFNAFKTALFLVRAAWFAIAAGEYAALAPILLWVAAIAAVILAAEELFNLFRGKETLLQKGWGGIKSFGANLVGGFGAGAGEPGKGGPSISDFTGFGGGTTTNNGGSSKTEINAPMTFHVPAGTDPKLVGPMLQDMIKGHFDKTSRETERSTYSPVVY